MKISTNFVGCGASSARAILSSAFRFPFNSFAKPPHFQIVGASILLMYDSDQNVGAWLIDFVKTLFVSDRCLDHRSSWKLGNHEDGFLFGLDNLIEVSWLVFFRIRRIHELMAVNCRTLVQFPDSSQLFALTKNRQ